MEAIEPTSLKENQVEDIVQHTKDINNLTKIVEQTNEELDAMKRSLDVCMPALRNYKNNVRSVRTKIEELNRMLG